jgi:hypothetical protein
MVDLRWPNVELIKKWWQDHKRNFHPKNGSWPSRNPSTAAEAAALRPVLSVAEGPALSFAEGANGLSPNR